METLNNLSDLSHRLGIEFDPSLQDWEILNADPERVGEFIDVYHSEHLNEGLRVNLVLLIIHSLERKISQQNSAHGLGSPQDWRRLVHILRERQKEYAWIIRHELSIREYLLEEEIPEYNLLLALFEEEFGDISQE
jgi:hypothetical protein